MFAPNLPTPVRSLFSRVHARRDRPTPCPRFDGVGMNLWSLVVVDAPDSVHLARVQCFIGLYRENAIAVRVIDRSAYDATSRVHAPYLRNGCCIYYLRPTGSAHL